MTMAILQLGSSTFKDDFSYSRTSAVSTLMLELGSLFLPTKSLLKFSLNCTVFLGQLG